MNSINIKLRPLMKITLNGCLKEISDFSDLSAFIHHHRRSKSPVIAELNGEIIKDHQWKKTVLREGDQLELISFVGGGCIVIRDSL
jgi:sulfur carrier protein